MIINLIQDVATPHNNVLINQFSGSKLAKINLWYAKQQDENLYQWKSDITGVEGKDNFFGTSLNVSFLFRCIFRKNEKFIIVGWMNINTRLLHLLFFVFRRPFNHWTDNPNPMSQGITFSHRVRRWIAYSILKYSRAKIFCVGKTTIDYFKSMGFHENRLVNLPIFVATEENIPQYLTKRKALRDRYHVPVDGFMLSAGSRLIKEKGYDLLIQSIADLQVTIRQTVRLIIVGSGVESENLYRQVADLGLSEQVVFEKWLEIEDFKALIACSDIFLHPARFDSYGGTTLGMALSVPVVGSTGAGAAVDRIEHGVNGFLYAAEDTKALSSYISQLVMDPVLRERIGTAGRQTAIKWGPQRGVEIILENSI